MKAECEGVRRGQSPCFFSSLQHKLHHRTWNLTCLIKALRPPLWHKCLKHPQS